MRAFYLAALLLPFLYYGNGKRYLSTSKENINKTRANRGKLSGKKIGPPNAILIDTAQLKKSSWYTNAVNYISEQELNISKSKHAEEYAAQNRPQGLTGKLKASSFVLEPNQADYEKGKSPSWQLPLSFKGIYADGKKWLAPGKNSVTLVKEKTISFNYDNAFVIEYTNSNNGIRQNFIISNAPSKGSSQLEVRMNVPGDWSVIQTNATELKFAKQEKGFLKPFIVYNQLRAWDANNIPLAASFEVKKNRFFIRVNAANAVYPVTIDPLSSSPTAILEGPQVADASFGFSLAGAGDVNGDGYSDVIIGAAGYGDSALPNVGKAFIYYGSAAGLSTTPNVTLSIPVGNIDGRDNFGQNVATAGDLNGDGYSDLVIGAQRASEGGNEEFIGRAYVYYGSSSGIHQTPSKELSFFDFFGAFGASVACAGDINGDGYSDLLVGGPGVGYQNFPIREQGRVFIYYGSDTGISSQANDFRDGDQTNDGFGSLVAGAGDINGDGYSDVIIEASQYSNGNGVRDGNLFVYMGSPSGLSATYVKKLSVPNNMGPTSFGSSIAAGTDFNGDGYADLAVAQPFYYDNYPHNISIVRIYYGSAAGLPDSVYKLDHTGAGSTILGQVVASAGDVNGDGYADLMVSGSQYDSVAHTTIPRVVVFHGSANGIMPGNLEVADAASRYNSQLTIAAAGDVNGDGFADIIIGVPDYPEGNNVNAGRALILNGAPAGLSDHPDVVFNSPGLSDAGFGQSIQYAGDINGDGFSDVVIGDPYFHETTIPGNYQGRAYVYYGTVTGLPAVPDLVLTNDEPVRRFGWNVSGGDINGDGYADVLVSSFSIFLVGGDVYVYYGSATGLTNHAADTIQPTVLGSPVTVAGDLNGDGYNDVLIGATVYYGSATGLSSTPGTILTTGNVQDFAGFGNANAGAGDVNGDGYGDVIIAAPGSNIGNNPIDGKVFVYLGGPSGVNPIPATVLTNASGSDQSFGKSVAGPGDINGDGYSDIVIGAPAFNSDAGMAFIYFGSPIGIHVQPSQWLSGPEQQFSFFGMVVSGAGDVNGDGYADVTVTAPYFNNVGGAFIYYGSPGGLPLSPSAILNWDGEEFGVFGNAAAGAGDVNGDGYSDILIGSLFGSNNSSGQAFAYYGSHGNQDRNNVRLYNPDLVTPLNNIDYSLQEFGAGLFVHSPFGNQKGRLVWEVESPGHPFSGALLNTSTGYSGRQNNFSNLGLTGTEIKNQVSKIGKSTKVRCRIEYDRATTITGQRYGPWRYPAGIPFVMNSAFEAALPLHFFSFTGVKEGSYVLLNWVMGDEDPETKYIVQRSSNGRDFSNLFTIEMNGSKHYQWIDTKPVIGNNYYRIEAIANSAPVFSRIINVVFNDASNEILFYPNPVIAGNSVTIKLPANTNRIIVKLMDVDGRLVLQKQDMPTGNTWELRIPNVPPGNYVLQLNTGDRVVSKHILINPR